MKIEVDLNDILRDEYGDGETLAESIRRQIVDKLSGDLHKRLHDRLDGELGRIMSAQINSVMAEKMPTLIDDIMNATYTPVSTYGQRGEPTTFRAEVIKAIAANMKYEPKQWSSDENAFTRAVKSIVEKQTEAVKVEITKHVDAKFKQDAIGYAVKLLAERLGLNKPGA
jgi:hypothetical protein